MRGVVFDLDETLLDRRGSLGAYACRLRSEFDPRGSSALDAFVAEFHRLDADGKIRRTQFFELLASQLLPTVSAGEIQRHFESYAWQRPLLFPGVVDMLREFEARGLRLGIITNGGEASQTAKITNSGLADLIDCFVISAIFGARKPDRSIFEHMTARLGIDPARSWFVGDDPRCDVWGAKQCGYRTAWIDRYSLWPMDLAPCYDAQLGSVLGVRDLVAA
jgi:putative hydrolase of the HAD superfamily